MRPPFAFVALAISLAIAYGQTASEDSLRNQLETNRASSQAHYGLGEIFFQQKNYQAAANEFRQSLNGDRQPPWSEAECHFKLAAIYTLAHQFARAQNEYLLAAQSSSGKSNFVPPLGTYLPGHGIAAPELLQETEPDYTSEARLAGLEGAVELTGTITEQGLAEDMQVTRSLGFGLDERALETIRQWRYQPGTLDSQPVRVYMTVSVVYRIPENHSRWHMIRAEFNPPAGGSAPRFSKTAYPAGAGISAGALEEGRVIRAIGRQGTATLTFDINERGTPVNFQVLNASAPIWGNEAIAVVRDWQFVPGAKSGAPVSVPCTIDLVWGARNLTPESLRWAVTQLSYPQIPALSFRLTDAAAAPK